MTYVIIIRDFADGTPCPLAGHFLMAFDHDADDGDGRGDFTTDPTAAMRFASKDAALMFWHKTSTVRPKRADGRPNRPLTASSVSIEPLADYLGEKSPRRREADAPTEAEIDRSQRRLEQLFGFKDEGETS